ncbi:hypothetical protein Q1W73_02505 [Asticcacaulis sp. ZE23SCel15]|uniref:hypothetical protein n=1 Tax=Asticcacaulis sp. ZE23SCel15 TaxID=3059027 RepID=UPI00265FCE89|nr:hypothetical protein [Asticcacaulis sp. ZE23SCel15]WKL57872.1 hypothetical protein Q1W73_02505 [Asticcacaulis sp. ZE23SCel15]
MMDSYNCNICKNVYDGRCERHGDRGGWLGYSCEVCGPYGLTEEAKELLDELDGKPFENIKRVALSHYISRTKDQKQGNYFLLLKPDLERLLRTETLPSPTEQIRNLIQIVGQYVQRTGEGFHGALDLASKVGARNNERLQELADQLVKKQLITMTANKPMPPDKYGKQYYYPIYDLTIDGWSAFEAEQAGKIAGNYGFMARQFNEPEFELFLTGIKAGVLKHTNFDLREVDTFKEVGVIDNIMRQKIRESAFVVVDLTHGNRGAYWEAGYAEGLGKPVIYMCEHKAFNTELSKPHFDTNHCSTIIWKYDNPTHLIDELTATIKTALSIRS